MKPPEVVTDAARLAALAAYDVLDTAPEPGFDALAQVARAVCGAPVALVSLVAGDRQWFKARAGFELRETDLERSVCAHALVEPDLLVIPDLTQDPRTRGNPLVTSAPKIRFYAGAPLRDDAGHAIGSLCVLDAEPRPGGLTPEQAEALRGLAAQAMAQLALRRAVAERDALLAGRAEADRRRIALLELGDVMRDLDDAEAMIRAASEIVGRTLGLARAGFGYLDAAAGILDVVTDWARDGVASIAGRHRFEDYGDLLPAILRGEALVIDDVRADPRTAADPAPLLALGIRALVNVAVRDRGRTVALLIVHDDRPRAWTPQTLDFLRNAADRLEAGVGRLRAEADQRLLNHELSHRMKNMMALVQAVVTQSLKAVPDRAPVETLMKRVLALASAHEVLLTQDGSSAPVGAIAQSAFEGLGLEGRARLSGPEVDLGPRATLSFAMLVHEMTTNALKHGALSADGGSVAVTWRVEGEPPELVIDWREAGGPPARPPSDAGFGSRLIRMGLTGTGGVVLRYPPAGLEAEFRAPLDQVRRS